jgi:hypothetical protein
MTEDVTPADPEALDEALMDMTLAVIRLERLTDKNFAILQLEELLKTMRQSL